MKVLRALSLGIVMSLFCFSARADFNPSNNNSATQFKTGNRNASTGIESAFYNPAGTVFGKDGFSIEFSVLPFSSSQSVYDKGYDKTYVSKTSSLFYPALNLAYKKDNFSVFSNIGITNGGGAGNYDDGLPQFETMGMLNVLAGVPDLIAAGLIPADTDPMAFAALTESTSSFSGSAYGIGGSVGAAYKFTDWVSAALAIQYSQQFNHQEGELNVTHPALGDLPKTEIDVDFTGSNVGLIFGLNIKPIENLMIAQTFRYYTELELTTKVNDEKSGGLFEDGAKTKNTYVPFYSLGIAYNVNDKMTLEGDMNLSLYSMLDLKDDTGYNAADNYNNGFDFGLGLEYQISDMINYGIGFTYAPAKMKKEKMSEMEFETTSLWLNTGATVNVSEKLAVNLALQFGVPTEEVNQPANLEEGILSDQTYSKDVSYAFGLGVAYRF